MKLLANDNQVLVKHIWGLRICNIYFISRIVYFITIILLNVLNQLVDKGNTIIIIEHNLDVIKQVDHIIDIGPEGGKNGGKLVDSGSPNSIIKNDKGYTSRFLSKELE